MASRSVESAGIRTGSLLADCVAGHGSATHPWFGHQALLAGPEAARNLADAIHFLCALHGRHPGVVDHAATRTVEPAARSWLAAGKSVKVRNLKISGEKTAAKP